MGIIANTITLVAPSDDMAEAAKAIADTWYTFTIIPPPTVERLGVMAERVIHIRLANGTIVKLPEGTVKAQLNGTEAPAVIGTHTLEGLLLEVDSVGMGFVPLESI